MFEWNNYDTNCFIVSVEKITDNGNIWDITVEPHANYLCAGLINANSSKTSAAAAEVARCCADCDPYQKYRKGTGKILAVGLDEAHLADPMARKLFLPGAFKLVRDEQTRFYRFLRADPNHPQELDPYDASVREKWIDAPPLLPPRLFSKRPAWKHAAGGVPLLFDFITGKKLEFRSSGSEAKQGDTNILFWIDEQIDKGSHFKQGARSLMASQGRGIWSATPENVSPYLMELTDRAKRGDPDVAVVKLLLDDNFTIDRARKETFFHDLRDDEERKIHYFGEPAIIGRRIYPIYDPQGVHGCEPNEVPDNATRYAILDPGRQHCATVLVAVDRDEKHRYVYDAFDIRNADAARWANEIKQRQGPFKFEAFVIDGQAGQAHSMAGGPSIAEQYWAALEHEEVRPRTMGTGKFGGFFPAQKIVAAREEALINWMSVRGDGPFAGTPLLQVVRGVCPELDKQIRYACTSSSVNDKRVMDQPQDLVTALEYAAAFNPGYHEPEPVKEDPADAVYKSYQEHIRRTRQRSQRHANRYQFV